MTTSHEEPKRQHEMDVATDFVAFLRESGYNLGNPRPGDTQGKREPDAVCESPTGIIGIEIADAYYNSEMAKIEWGHAPEASLGYHLALLDPDLELGKAIEKTLIDHSSKLYSTPTTFLVLNAAHEPFTASDDAPVLLQQIQVPENCHFRGVYLRLKRNGDDRTDFIDVPLRGSF